MTPHLYRVIVPVRDVDAAARFYGAIFGDPGRRISPGRHYFNCGGTILACLDPARDGEEVQFRPNPEWFYFAVEDIEATYAAVKQAGATPAGDVHGGAGFEIVKRPWGERSFYAYDPFGNPICFVDRTTIFTGED